MFDRHHILHHINRDGYYKISARDIRMEREPRLMCKFDHRIHLAKPFKDYKLSILPISRSEYIIGSFEIFQTVKYNNELTPTRVSIPDFIDTIKKDDLYSESSALHAAHVSGMFQRLLGLQNDVPLLQTVSGRMGSKNFHFDVNLVKGGSFPINVESAQIEIDGGYESKEDFVIVEAKKEMVKDFNIRQLFYPYRVWSNRTTKRIQPVFFTHSNDIFSFFIYTFDNADTLGSIRLVEQKDFVISDEKISIEEIVAITRNTQIVQESREIPFPQADTFERVVDLLGLLYEKNLTANDVAENYDFNIRQSYYHADVGVYLGLVEKVKKERITYFRLTQRGRTFMSMSFKQKYLALVTSIMEHAPFKVAFLEWLQNNRRLSTERCIQIIKEQNGNVNPDTSTIKRRAQSVKKWSEWIYRLTQL
nr:translation elongation factor [Metabacillus malikii]